MKKILILLALAAVVAIGIFGLIGQRHTSQPVPAVVADTAAKPAPTSVAVVMTNQEKSAMSAAEEAPRPAAPIPAIPKPTQQELALKFTQLIKQALSSTNEADHDMIYTNLLQALIAQDPAAAGRLAESLDAGPGREELLQRTAQAWAAVDPNGAIAWAANLTDAVERTSALTDSIMQIGQTDPAAAVALAQKSDYGVSRATLENLMQLWAGNDLPAALNWATQQPAGENRDQSLSRIAFIQSQTAPMDAANLVVSRISPGPVQNEAIMTVLHQWGLLDMAAATAWADKLPAGPLADRAKQELTGVANSLKALQK